MEFRQLQYFLTLCNELHFSEAAYRLGISQPTLSQQIRVLEDEIGVPLFDRIGKKTVKTEAGDILERYGIEIMQQLENAKNAIADLTELHTGQLRVAVLPSDLDYRFTALLVDFHKEFPNTKVQVQPSIEIVDMVLDNEVDIGVGLAIQPDQRLTRIPFFKETYSLFVRKEHELAHKTIITSKELAQLPFVMYPKGYIGRDLIAAWGREQGINIETVMETGSVTSLFRLVKEGVGVTIQPSQLYESFQSLGICEIQIEHAPTRDLEIVYRSDKYMSLAAKAFMKRLEVYFQDEH